MVTSRYVVRCEDPPRRLSKCDVELKKKVNNWGGPKSKNNSGSSLSGCRSQSSVCVRSKASIGFINLCSNVYHCTTTFRRAFASFAIIVVVATQPLLSFHLPRPRLSFTQSHATFFSSASASPPSPPPRESNAPASTDRRATRRRSPAAPSPR
jgi:hypothetical protein